MKVGPDTDIDLIDMPGHERFVRTMISGATGIDAVLLVVAANEGIKPQTIEHVDIAEPAGPASGRGCDQQGGSGDPRSRPCRVAEDAVRLLARSGLDVVAACHDLGAARKTASTSCAAHSKPWPTTQHPRAADGVVFLPIDRAFSMAGHGPVVTGTLRGAAVTRRRHAGIVAVAPAPCGSGRSRSMACACETATPGQRVALNLRDIEIAELERGMALTRP